MTIWTMKHDMFEEARLRIEQAIQATAYGLRGAGIILDGPSGAGKTILLKHLEGEEQPWRDESGAKIPRVRVKMPANAHPRAMYAAILGAIGDREPDRGKEWELAERTIKQLNNVENKVLMIDDVQHVEDHCRGGERLRLTDGLKNIIDGTKTTLVLAGLPRVHDLIASNEQLFVRLSASVGLRGFWWHDEDERGMFLDTVTTMMDEYSDLKWPCLDSEELGFRVYVATGGLIGYVVKVLEEAERTAKRRGSSQVTMNIMAEAYRVAVYRKTQGFSQPFDMNIEIDPDDIEIRACVDQMGESVATFH